MPNDQVHERAAKTAERLIDRHGRFLSLLVPVKTGPAHRPTIDWQPTPIVGAVLSYAATDTDGDLIRLDDKRILVAATGLLISDEMRIRDASVDYSIVRVDTLEPGNTRILYTLQVRI